MNYCARRRKRKKNVTSVTARWLVAAVKMEARFLVTIPLSSAVSCSTRWYLRVSRASRSLLNWRFIRQNIQPSQIKTKWKTMLTVHDSSVWSHTVAYRELTVAAPPSAVAWLRRSRGWSSSPAACDGSPLTRSPLPSPAHLDLAPTHTRGTKVHAIVVCTYTEWWTLKKKGVF